MPWVQVPHDLSSDKRIFTLANLLGVDRCSAVGAVTLIWAWALDATEDGRIGNKMQDRDLAEIACYRGDAKVFMDALLEAKFINGTKIVDFEKVCGPYVHTKKVNAKRQAEYRKTRKTSSNVTRDITHEKQTKNNYVTPLEVERELEEETTQMRPPVGMLIFDYNELLNKWKFTKEEIAEIWNGKGDFVPINPVAYVKKQVPRLREQQTRSLQSRRPLFTEEEAAAAIAAAEREAEERRQPVDEETRAAIKRAREQIRVAVNGKA